MSEISDDQMVVEILNFFYPKNPISEHQVNDSLGDLAAEMYADALEQSQIMHLVPRPPSIGRPPGVSWLVNQGVKAVWRSKGGDEIYNSVRVTSARNFASKYQMAKRGI